MSYSVIDSKVLDESPKESRIAINNDISDMSDYDESLETKLFTKDGVGYVQLVDCMGSDLSIVNAARVSYGRVSKEFNEKDMKLLKYLWTHEHTSPFRHETISFKIKCPIFVLRQWMKHTIGCAWNEQSGRYTELKYGYFKPQDWRLQDTSNKQGSIVIADETIREQANAILDETYESIENCYKKLLELGIGREQARIVLPLSTYTECVWTASLQAIVHFLDLRLDSNAQYEIREFAMIILELTEKKFPKTFQMLREIDFIQEAPI